MDDPGDGDGCPPTPGDRRCVAVVGGGPVGLLLANLLAAGGVPVVVYERRPQPVDLPRAVHLDDDALRTLQTAGLDGEVAAAACSSPGMELVGPDGRVFWRLERPVDRRPQGHPPSSLVHQPELEAVLRRGLARFSHAQLCSGWEVVDLRVAPGPAPSGGVRLTLAGAGRTVVREAAFAVGCDGAGSGVRRLLGLSIVDHGFEQRWLVVDVREAPPRRTHPLAQQVCDPSRPVTYVPVGGPDGRRCRWEFLVHPGEDPAALTTDPALSRLLSPWLGAGGRPRIERMAVYRFHALRARPWRSGPALLAGDAAHQMPPFLGQGLCAGIRDAANLAWKLRLAWRGLAGDGLLDTYEAERGPHVRTVTALSVLLGLVVHGGDPAGRVLRRLLRLAAVLPAPLRAPLEQPPMPGLRTGPLVPRGPMLRRLSRRLLRPRAGAHPVGRPLPQPVVACGGRPLPLDDALGDGFALLAVTPSALPAAGEPLGGWFSALGRTVLVHPAGSQAPPAGSGGGAVVQDVGGTLVGWFRAQGAAAAIVRPDRCVFALAGDAAAVRRALVALRRALAGGAPASGAAPAGSS